ETAAGSRAAGVGPLQVLLPLSKKDIASLLGTTPEPFSRALARLTADGLIAVDGEVVSLLDPQGLEDRVGDACAGSGRRMPGGWARSLCATSPPARPGSNSSPQRPVVTAAAGSGRLSSQSAGTSAGRSLRRSIHSTRRRGRRTQREGGPVNAEAMTAWRRGRSPLREQTHHAGRLC